MKIIQTLPLKARVIDESLESFYADIMHDYRAFFPLIFSWCCDHGYTLLDEEGEPTFVSPNEQLASLKEKYPEHYEILLRFAKMASSKGTTSSSTSSLFYASYKNNVNSRLTKSRMEFMTTHIHDETERKKRVISLELTAISLEEWANIATEVQNLNEDKLKIYWNQYISKRVVNDDRKLGKQIQEIFKIQCRRPNDVSYCYILSAMLTRQLCSQIEKAKFHANELQESIDLVATFNHPLLQLITTYATELTDVGSGLSKYVMKKAPQQVVKPQKDSNINTQVAVLDQDKYLPIVNATYKERMAAYAQWKVSNALANRLKKRKYVLYPNLANDPTMPIGNSSLGSFRINVQNDVFYIQINDCPPIEAYSSKQLCKVQLTEEYQPSKSKKPVIAGYKIVHQMLKGRIYSPEKQKGRPITYGDPITSIVKEIGLQKRKNGYSISLYCNKDISDDNFNMMRWFGSQKYSPPAEPESKLRELVPDKFIASGLDLNISMPMPRTLVEVNKDATTGHFVVDGIGYANVKDISHLQTNGPLCGPLIDCRDLFDKLTRIIREVKDCHNNILNLTREKRRGRSQETKLCQESQDWLDQKCQWNPTTQPVTPEDYFKVNRTKIQHCIKQGRKALAKLNYDSRATGHENLAELVRIIEAEDSYKDMISAFQRIHLKPKEQLPASKNPSKRRKNKKKYVARRYGSLAAADAVKNAVNIVFSENLNMKQDKDNLNGNNSLTRLFSGRMLNDAITAALQHVGVAHSPQADPRGTSKTNSITGALGSRSKPNKRQLFIQDNQQWVFVDADLNASLNVTISGLNRSIVPYKFDPNHIGPRLQAFFKRTYGVKNLFFYEDDQGNVVASKSALINQVPLSGRIYYRQGKFLTEKQHFQEEELMQSLQDTGMIDTTVELDLLTQVKFDNFQASANIPLIHDPENGDA